MVSKGRIAANIGCIALALAGTFYALRNTSAAFVSAQFGDRTVVHNPNGLQLVRGVAGAEVANFLYGGKKLIPDCPGSIDSLQIMYNGQTYAVETCTEPGMTTWVASREGPSGNAQHSAVDLSTVDYFTPIISGGFHSYSQREASAELARLFTSERIVP